MSRQLFPVSCKIALFNPAGTKVVVAEYTKDNFGLPGGHIEAGEDPDIAMVREVREELGLEIDAISLDRVHFSSHPNGKIVLGYHSTIEEIALTTANPDEVMQFHWVDLEDIELGRVDIGVYQEIVMKSPR